MDSCHASLLVSLFCLFVLPGCINGQTQYGDHFIVALPFGRAYQSGAASDLQLVLTNPHAADITVTLDRSGQSTSSIVVNAKDSLIETLFGYMLPDAGLSNRTVVLRSQEVFGVLVQGTRAYDGYLAIPVSQWGWSYAVATLCKGPDSVCQIVVVASEDYTNVIVDIPAENHGFVVDVPGVSYAPVAKETSVLMRNEAWVISRPYEMSGAKVVSNASVGVLTGAQWTSYKGSVGVVTEQLPPLKALGREYVSIAGVTVRVVATEPNTKIRTSVTHPILMEKAGQWVEAGTFDAPVHFRADRAILLVAFGRMRLSLSNTAYPVLLVLTPVTQFLSRMGNATIFPTHFYSGQKLLVITREKSRGSVLYGSQPLPTVSSYSAKAVRWDYYMDIVTQQDLSEVTVNVADTSSVMAVYVEAQSATCSFLSPLAMRFDNINPQKDCGLSTPQKPGDTVDNDCDGMVDEDDCDIPTGIDCQLPVGEFLNSWGKRFVAVIPAYLSSLNISLFLTTLSTSVVSVSVNDLNSTMIGGRLSVDLSTNTGNVLSGDRSSNIIRVSSDEDISVTYNAEGSINMFRTGGSMRLIPEKALGREHYLMTVCIDKCYFQVVGVYPNTTVDIYLRMAPKATNTNVTFLGIVYYSGDVIRTDVGEYEALQIECLGRCSLTGSLVASSKPVAVFSVSNMLSLEYVGSIGQDNFMEQMPPVEAYGHDFIVKQQPSRIHDQNYCNIISCEDFVWIVASEINTTVRVSNDSTGAVYNHYIDEAGQAIKLLMGGDIMQISSDNAVLVVQVLRTLSKNDGGMLVVPPMAQYASHDVIMFQPTTSSAQRQVVVYTDDRPAPAIEVDGTVHSSDGQLDGSLFNVSYWDITYTGGANASTEVRVLYDGAFGGYVSDLGEAEKISSLAHGVDRINEVCKVTKPVSGDAVDNDCDGYVDEEPCLVGTLEDTDGDGRFNEDCDVPPEELTSSFAPSSSEIVPVTSDIIATTFRTFAHDATTFTAWTPAFSTATEVIAASHTLPTTSWSCVDGASTFSIWPTASVSITELFTTRPPTTSWSCVIGESSFSTWPTAYVTITELFTTHAPTTSWSCVEGESSFSTWPTASVTITELFTTHASSTFWSCVDGESSFSTWPTASLTTTELPTSDISTTSLSGVDGATSLTTWSPSSPTSVDTPTSWSCVTGVDSWSVPLFQTLTVGETPALSSSWSWADEGQSPSSSAVSHLTSWSRITDDSSLRTLETSPVELTLQLESLPDAITSATTSSMIFPTRTSWSCVEESSCTSQDAVSNLEHADLTESISVSFAFNASAHQYSTAMHASSSQLLSSASAFSGFTLAYPRHFYDTSSTQLFSSDVHSVTGHPPLSPSTLHASTQSQASAMHFDVSSTLAPTSPCAYPDAFINGACLSATVTTTEPPATTPMDTTTQPETTTSELTTQPQDTTASGTTPTSGAVGSSNSVPTTSEVVSSSSSVTTTSAGTTTTTATPSLTVTPSVTSSLTSNSLCGCSCPPWLATTTMASASLSSVLNSIVNELTVEKADLSSVRRKKTSAEDNRPSAQTGTTRKRKSEALK